MNKVYIESIGIAAPGLEGWQKSQAILQGEDYQFTALEKYKPTTLPPNERRRATQLVRLSFRAAEDAMLDSSVDASEMATVFSSSCGDMPIVDQVCRALTEESRAVSPTQFHNSVHNSAAGYWSIGVGSEQTSTSLSAFDDSFALGLIEASAMVLVDKLPTLLAVYDISPPEPLLGKRAVTVDFSMAMVLTPEQTENSIACFTIEILEAGELSLIKQQQLLSLFNSNPAAKALPLLELLANKIPGEITLSLPSGGVLQVNIQLC